MLSNFVRTSEVVTDVLSSINKKFTIDVLFSLTKPGNLCIIFDMRGIMLCRNF